MPRFKQRTLVVVLPADLFLSGERTAIHRFHRQHPKLTYEGLRAPIFLASSAAPVPIALGTAVSFPTIR